MSWFSTQTIPVQVSQSFPSWSKITATGFGHSSVVIPLLLQSKIRTSPKLVSFARWYPVMQKMQLILFVSFR
jgi:hypothetical protein